jgi:ferredoxin
MTVDGWPLGDADLEAFMLEIKVDRATCMGYGNCVVVAPDIFDVDDEGLVVTLRATVENHRLDDVRRAEYDCPTDSIRFVEHPDESS